MREAAVTVQTQASAPLDLDLPPSVGPILFARGATGENCYLSALLALPSWNRPPPLRAAEREAAPARLVELYGWTLWSYDFSLPARPDAAYELGGRRFPVAADMTGDVRVAFVSCNGQERGDGDRPPERRNLMWRRLAAEHRARPFSLLLQGGDQVYADEAMRSHPEIRRWTATPARRRPGIRFTAEMRDAVRRWFLGRYLTLMAQDPIADLVACVPSLMMWDDHDIMDGWGSHPAATQESPVGKGVFAAAREMFMLFQLGIAPDAVSPLSPDPAGRSFALGAAFPRFRVLAPDLRSERTAARVMGPAGWQAFDRTVAAVRENERVLVVSSVPALGPRLSLVERVLGWLPKRSELADDLRDQWQSYAHRLEWRRFLATLETLMETRNASVTALSGEIHLATRATMRLRDGRLLHQLVASGISHPEPSRAFARALGLLARFGDAPLPGRPIRIAPLPGHRAAYVAERNYLVVERAGDAWTASWELEKSGRTAPLPI